MAEKSKQMMVRVTPDIAHQLERLSERDERTISQTIRLAIKKYLEADRELVPTS